MSERVALRMGLSPSHARDVRYAALLHDVGKVAVPSEILLKPGPLTEAEWVQMRRHTIVGGDLVARIDAFAHLAPAVRASHERWDGDGYPDGIAGESIPLAARIIAACDTYDAIVTDRPYRPARTVAQARQELCRVAGIQLDARVVEALLEELSERRLDRPRARVEPVRLYSSAASRNPSPRPGLSVAVTCRQYRRGECPGSTSRPRAQRVGPRRQPAHRARRARRVVFAHVQVAVAGHFHDPPLCRRAGGQLLVVDRARAGHVQAAPTGVAQAAGEVDLVGVDEEVGVHVPDLRRRLAAHEQRRGLAPVHLARVLAGALHGVEAVHEQRARERRGDRGKPPRACLRGAVSGAAGEHPRRPRPGAPAAPATARASRLASSSESSFSSSAYRPRARCISAESFSALPRRSSSAIVSSTAGCSRAASADPSREPLSSTSTSLANGSSERARARSRPTRAPAARAGRCSRRSTSARSRARPAHPYRWGERA